MAATPFGLFWPTSWSTDAVFTGSQGSLAAASNQNSSAYTNSAASPNEIAATEIGIAIPYGVSVSGGGVTISILGDVNGTNYQTLANPFSSVILSATASTTYYFHITILSEDLAKFVVNIANPTGNTAIVPTITYRQAQGQTG